MPPQSDGQRGRVDNRPTRMLTATLGAAIVVGLVAALIAVLRVQTDGGRSAAAEFVHAVGRFAQATATQTTTISRDAARPVAPAARARVSTATAELLPQLHRYQRLLVTAPANVDLPQHRFIVAAHGLTTALGGLAHWSTARPGTARPGTAHPGNTPSTAPSTSAPPTASLQAAVRTWNAAATGLWQVAGAGTPPVIGR